VYRVRRTGFLAHCRRFFASLRSRLQAGASCSGRFPWAEHWGRFERLDEPDVSYHGVVYTEALGPAAYIGDARSLATHRGVDDPPAESRQRRPATDMKTMTPTRIASTSSATFHGLFGYSPRIAPVTPFITHWKLLLPYV
jgi:hypothetical protein